MTKPADLWRKAVAELNACNKENAVNEVRWILQSLGYNLYASEMQSEDIARFNDLIAKRKTLPLAYVLGETDFFGLTFKVDERVLIPRNDSEVVVQRALDLIPQNANYKIADFGTGSGALGLTIAANRPQTQVNCYDLSIDALKVAKANGEALGLNNASFIQADILEFIAGEFDLIISNPPYVTLDEMQTLTAEVLQEPRMALTDEGDGLRFYQAISQNARKMLKTGGYLVFEIGYQQCESVCEILKNLGYNEINSGVDAGNRPRYISARWGE